MRATAPRANVASRPLRRLLERIEVFIAYLLKVDDGTCRYFMADSELATRHRMISLGPDSVTGETSCAAPGNQHENRRATCWSRCRRRSSSPVTDITDITAQEKSEMIHPTVKLGLPLLLALARAVHDDGTGFGSTASARTGQLQWKSSDSVSGSMNATLSDGQTFTGQFFQITSDTTVDNLGPLWAGWGGYGRQDTGEATGATGTPGQSSSHTTPARC